MREQPSRASSGKARGTARCAGGRPKDKKQAALILEASSSTRPKSKGRLQLGRTAGKHPQALGAQAKARSKQGGSGDNASSSCTSGKGGGQEQGAQASTAEQKLGVRGKFKHKAFSFAVCAGCLILVHGDESSACVGNPGSDRVCSSSAQLCP